MCFSCAQTPTASSGQKRDGACNQDGYSASRFVIQSIRLCAMISFLIAVRQFEGQVLIL